MKCVILLSGGLDSYTAAAIARSEGFDLYALTIDYGQRHAHELTAARRVAASLGVARHLELPLDLRGIGGAAVPPGIPPPRAPAPPGPPPPAAAVFPPHPPLLPP